MLMWSSSAYNGEISLTGVSKTVPLQSDYGISAISDRDNAEIARSRPTGEEVGASRTRCRQAHDVNGFDPRMFTGAGGEQTDTGGAARAIGPFPIDRAVSVLRETLNLFPAENCNTGTVSTTPIRSGIALVYSERKAGISCYLFTLNTRQRTAVELERQ